MWRHMRGCLRWGLRTLPLAPGALAGLSELCVCVCVLVCVRRRRKAPWYEGPQRWRQDTWAGVLPPPPPTRCFSMSGEDFELGERTLLGAAQLVRGECNTTAGWCTFL